MIVTVFLSRLFQRQRCRSWPRPAKEGGSKMIYARLFPKRQEVRQPIVTSSVIRHHGRLARQLRSAAIRRVFVECFRMACRSLMRKPLGPALDDGPQASSKAIPKAL